MAGRSQGDARRQRLQPPPMTLADALHEVRFHEPRFGRSYQTSVAGTSAARYILSRVQVYVMVGPLFENQHTTLTVTEENMKRTEQNTLNTHRYYPVTHTYHDIECLPL